MSLEKSGSGMSYIRTRKISARFAVERVGRLLKAVLEEIGSVSIVSVTFPESQCSKNWIKLGLKEFEPFS